MDSQTPRTIELVFVGELQWAIGIHKTQLHIPAETTVGDLEALLASSFPELVPHACAGQGISSSGLIVLVNGRNSSLLGEGTPLAEGAKIVLTKPIGGG